MTRGKRRISYSRDFTRIPGISIVFPRFPLYSRDFHRIPIGFPGFPSDFQGLAIPRIRRFPLVSKHFEDVYETVVILALFILSFV
jgi:hypothetical protein